MVIPPGFKLGINVPTYEERTFAPELAGMGAQLVRQVLTPRADLETRLKTYGNEGLQRMGVWVKESAYPLDYYAKWIGDELEFLQVWNEAESEGKTSGFLPKDVRYNTLNKWNKEARIFKQYNPEIKIIAQGIGNGQPSELDDIDPTVLDGVAAHMYWKPASEASWFPTNFYNVHQLPVYITEIDIKDHPDTVVALAGNPVVAAACVFTCQAWFDPRANEGWYHALFDINGKRTYFADTYEWIAEEVAKVARAPIQVGAGIRAKMDGLGDNPIEDTIFFTNANGSKREEVRGFKGRYIASNAHPDEQWRVIFIPWGAGN